ncbi:hypothetical protein GCM10010249_10720 [Streptomyces roseolilacinus]|uniref:Uncharacterized protein n=1 Tax=Streptomyces roseolilacinus TaxID=66904 RepID=A0A918EI60_9ACTN|nr:hypothetical protein GCM10010249_10720 [Streptomyces roseolilacinus]
MPISIRTREGTAPAPAGPRASAGLPPRGRRPGGGRAAVRPAAGRSGPVGPYRGDAGVRARAARPRGVVR